MNRAGMTLLEVMFAVAILTIVMGTLMGLSISIGDTSQIRQAQATAYFEARRGMQTVVLELRQARNQSLTVLPANNVSYQVATDLDGNGSAVDVSGKIELSSTRTIKRDTDDANGDGKTLDQVILIDGANTRVLANGLLADEDANGNNVLDTGEDTNGNGVLDHGLWFSTWQAGIRRGVQVDIQVMRTSRLRFPIVANLSEVVIPRN
jgi:prepilin-type N-terminal cleavage/methylation domain-containing protein